jgi:hypothetical protein
VSDGRTIIEINGVKMSVDLRTAVRVDQLRVGDRVKVLVKNYSDYSVHPGIIIGFDPFKNLPTIIAAYIEIKYDKTELKFVHFNANSKDTELVKAIDDDAIDLSKSDVEAFFDREILKHNNAIGDLNNKREYFRRHFRSYWSSAVEPVPVAPVEAAAEPVLAEVPGQVFEAPPSNPLPF